MAARSSTADALKEDNLPKFKNSWLVTVYLFLSMLNNRSKSAARVHNFLAFEHEFLFLELMDCLYFNICLHFLGSPMAT